MDDAVLKAMARWPDVPDVFGWLSLDRRGRWCLRGEPITHPGAVGFIARNYQSDRFGRWYFQNGPQRVHVALDYAPWIYRVDGVGDFLTHTGLPVTRIERVLADEEGNLLLVTEHGVGLVDDRDLTTVAERLSGLEASAGTVRGQWFEETGRRLPVEPVRQNRVSAEFGFQPDPQPAD
jgi:hypothetical protein